jgi:hypothetical protein
MISCQKCEFKILPKMRFALVKNFCPSCGSTLLSDADSQEINSINKRLQSQDFMISLSEQLNKDLVQNLIYDLSIFIKFDLNKEIIKAYSHPETSAQIEPQYNEVQEERKKMPLKPVSRADAQGQSRQLSAAKNRYTEDSEDEDDDFEDSEEDSDDMSDDYEDDDNGDGEEIDDRVKRLKKLYDSSPTLGKFKGISRS